MHATVKGFRWVVAALFLAASWGIVMDASACCGGGNAEPGGNNPTGYNLSGPAITGLLTLKQTSIGYADLKFNGTCQGKEVNFGPVQWPIDKPVNDYERYCTGDVNQCAEGGFIESTIMAIDAYVGPALLDAGCTNAMDRGANQLFVQAVPKFTKDTTISTLYADVVLLFLIPQY